jgi:hypothetical protein
MITGIVYILPTNPATDEVDTTEGRSVDFSQLRQAVSKAIWQKDHTTFKTLIDEALGSVSGVDYGRVLTLQANWFLIADLKHAAQGFVLVDEARPLVRKNPEALLECLINALALCYVTGDTERARKYEGDASTLLLEHGADPQVRAKRHRLQMSISQIAYLRADYATAYWHAVQAVNNIADPTVPAEERRSYETVIQLNIATVCLRVRRFYECQEALDLAEQSTVVEPQILRVTVLRSELMRQLGYVDQASELLAGIAEAAERCTTPEVQARYYWVSALVAQDAGDVPRFNRLVSKAIEVAAEHGRDFLLTEIQRFRSSTSI